MNPLSDTSQTTVKLPHVLPIGYKYVLGKQGKEIAIDEPAAVLIRLAFGCVFFGKMSVREMATKLAVRGLKGRRGKPIGPTGVWKMLRNPLYAGLSKTPPGFVSEKFIPLISLEGFEKVQAIRADSNRKRKEPKRQLCNRCKRLFGKSKPLEEHQKPVL